MKTVKTIVEGIIAMTVFLFIIGICGYMENHYSMNATVDYYKGHVAFVDEVGEAWYDDEITNYKIGDEVRITFDTNTTDSTRLDDKICKIK